MKVIKNNSQARIKVNIMIIRPDNQTQSFDLAYGDYIIVDDSAIATKSIILQQKKRNIDVLNDIPENTNLYQKYSSNNEIFNELYNLLKPEEKSSVSTESIAQIEEPIKAQEEVVIKVEKNKGGRPKGSTNKKKKKKSKKTKSVENNSAENQN